MLVSLRKNLKTFVIKILMVILALTFVLWGIGDVIKNKRTAALKVGGISYSVEEVGPLFNEQVKMLERQLNYQFNNDDLESPEFRAIVLNQVINRLLLDKLANSMTAKVSDDMVKYQIASIPFFYKDGKFSKEALDQFLAGNHITEKQFVAHLREEIKHQNVNTVFALLDYTPSILRTTIDKAVNQKRSALVYTVASKNIPAAPTPTEEDLKSLYDQQAKIFEIPETRDINYALISTDIITEKPVISDDMTQEEYSKRKRFMVEPEKRNVSQLIFKSEDEAKQALAELKSGKTIKQLAEEHKKSASETSLGDITRDSLSADITNKIFEKNKGEYTDPIQSAFGYHIFFIEDVIPQKSKDFASVKEEIKKELYNEKLFELLSNVVQKIESDIAMNTKYEELVQKYGLKGMVLKNIKKSADNTDALKKLIVDTGFANDANSTHLISSSSSEFYIVSPTINSPASQVPFEKAKPDLLKMWYVKEDARSLQIQAQKFLEQLKAGADGQKAMTEFKLDKPVSVIVSSVDKSGLSQELVDEILSLRSKGDVTKPVADQSGYKIAVLDQVMAGAQSSPETIAKYRFPISSELSISLLTKLRKQYEVEVNAEMLPR